MMKQRQMFPTARDHLWELSKAHHFVGEHSAKTWTQNNNPGPQRKVKLHSVSST